MFNPFTNNLDWIYVQDLTPVTPYDIGNGTDFTRFEDDGTMQQFGAATVWDDVYPSSVTVMATGANAAAFTTYNGNLRAYEFVGTGPSLKEINIGFQFYHSHKITGTMVIKPHLHLFIPADTTVATTPETVIFGCEYTWAGIDQLGAITTTTITGQRTVTKSDLINNNAILEFNSAAVSATGKGISSVFMCRIFRDPTADSWGQSVWLKSADVHIEKDSLGSHLEYIK